MEWLPTVRAEVAKLATLLLKVPLPSGVAPSKNVTVPVASENAMKALNVQKGVSTAEIAWLMGAIGFQIANCALRVSSDVSWLLGKRPL
jgi:hypothetical protein